MTDSERQIEIRARKLREELVPSSREAEDDEVTARFDVPEIPTRSRKTTLPEVVVGEINEQARSFKNEYLRLVWLAIAVASLVYCLATGIIRIGAPG